MQVSLLSCQYVLTCKTVTSSKIIYQSRLVCGVQSKVAQNEINKDADATNGALPSSPLLAWDVMTELGSGPCPAEPFALSLQVDESCKNSSTVS